jgi:hypothetical protein
MPCGLLMPYSPTLALRTQCGHFNLTKFAFTAPKRPVLRTAPYRPSGPFKTRKSLNLECNGVLDAPFWWQSDSRSKTPTVSRQIKRLLLPHKLFPLKIFAPILTPSSLRSFELNACPMTKLRRCFGSASPAG